MRRIKLYCCVSIVTSFFNRDILTAQNSASIDIRYIIYHTQMEPFPALRTALRRVPSPDLLLFPLLFVNYRPSREKNVPGLPVGGHTIWEFYNHMVG